MKPVKPSVFETVFVLLPLAITGLGGLITLAVLPIGVVLDVYEISQGRAGYGIAGGVLIFFVLGGISWIIDELL